ncbi:MAG: Re/Si-specific NAD(P)(+) transhydrogenase subunit alpha [Gemmatimonadales bacterium]
MRIGVPKETVPGERRVALIPDSAGKLIKAGHEVVVEKGAGAAASFPDALFEAAGARIAGTPEAVLEGSAVVLKVQRPADAEAGRLPEGSALISTMQPATAGSLLDLLTRRKVTAFAMELVPRITRAQSMDVLSSQATIAGYKAVLLGAAELGRVLPMLTTAAGTLAPARAFVLGAGVAGLQAIATARRLGAVVSAFDVRAAVKEQVQSLGASFVEAEVVSADAEGSGGYARELAQDQHERELAVIHKHLRAIDLVITTAAIPGKPAPRLITEAMLRDMKPGAVIIDLAAETGGNCELTRAGETVVAHGVSIVGAVNLPATVPLHASQMYSRNVTTFLEYLVKDGALAVNLDDPIIGPMCLTHAGTLRAGRSDA